MIGSVTIGKEPYLETTVWEEEENQFAIIAVDGESR
jgi:hypothetical protein